jgi:hypothetical protein
MECTACSQRAGKPDASSVALYDRFCHVEAQPDTGVLVAGSVMNSIKPLKDVIEMFRTYAHPLVNHTDHVAIFMVL